MGVFGKNLPFESFSRLLLSNNSVLRGSVCTIIPSFIEPGILYYTILFYGNSEDFTTSKDGNDGITLKLANNQNAPPPPNVYGQFVTSNINLEKFFASDLYDQAGNSISEAKITVDT